MIKWILGIGGAGLIGYASVNYLKKKQDYEDEVRKSLVTIYNTDDSIIPSIAKLPANYIDKLVKIYLSNVVQDISEQANLLIGRAYVRTGNAFNQRVEQLNKK